MSPSGKKAICFYFQVHQPFRLKRYRFFDLGHDHYYYDDFSNESIMRKVAEKCYLPANNVILDLIQKHKGKFKITFSLSGLAISQFRLYAPEVLDSFRKLADTGMVEFLAETNSHSLISLRSRSEFERQIVNHKEMLKVFLGVDATSFRNTELIYSDTIGSWVADMGFKSILTEGAKHVLGWKSPNFLYCNSVNPRLKVLLRNFVLSDDIAFRFSNKGWNAWPLTADKYASWINKLAPKSELINVFLDYETFGEHNWKETGIFDFLCYLPGAILKKTPFRFMTPTEIADKLQPVSAISIPSPISWADEERDITAWLGNELQVAALDKLYSLTGKVNKCEDELIKKDWEYLQSSDHFYYMATKFFSDGAVHAYFNPYDTPYDAFMNYMNVLSDFEIRLQKIFPDTAEQDQIFKLGTQIIEKEMLIEKQVTEIEKLTKKIAKMNHAVKSTIKRTKKPSGESPATDDLLVINGATGKLKANPDTTKTTKPGSIGPGLKLDQTKSKINSLKRIISYMKIEFIFETSWEVCNKVGGIHTVISTKALKIVNQLGDKYILIGPDVWREDVINPEFIPDESLFIEWKARAASEGLRVKIGRWNISGRPIVILIDFTLYFGQQNEIFAIFWETYKLDSITGQWDYVEPALFGYAAGKVIESFSTFYHENHNTIAQFHEWMTGTGILYLKKYAPWIATAFTTHATVLGRCIAGNNRPLYSKMEEYNPLQIAREFNIVAKQSLEKISAAVADVFTTVSQITSRECHHFLGKEVDFVTPNGFEDSFVPAADIFEERRQIAREKLLSVTEAVLGYSVSEDCVLVVNSGRYEFRNKGVDILIDSLGELQKKGDIEKECIVFLLIPAYHKGPRQDIVDILYNNGPGNGGDRCLTHSLHYPATDPVLQRVAANNLDNSQKSKVKIIFVPCYLNGNDGIFNMPYFDLLIGFDLSVFPSYYEPWGYTPLESQMFSIPTVTTSLSGFGLWVKTYFENPGNGISVIERTDDNEIEVIAKIWDFMKMFIGLNNEELRDAREKAHAISRIALWDNLVNYYIEAYEHALLQSSDRREEPREFVRFVEAPGLHIRKPHQVPVWKDIYVQSDVPEKLASLKDLANNLWWSWNIEAELLFRRMDPSLWEEVRHNPKLLLEKIDYKRLLVLEDDDDFVANLKNVNETFKAYTDRPDNPDLPSVAYFSMEFGIHPCLKIYSGGLGILAGDYLKEASDSNFNITGVGLLYRYGYFNQKLGPKGEQLSIYEAEEFSHLPINPVKDSKGNHLYVSLVWPGRIVKIRVWEAKVGKVRLVLLDTDFDDNLPEDRTVTHYLYGGDNENRLRQELILGIGGIRALVDMGLKPDIYHSNEGHSAFISLERLRGLINDQHLTFYQALEAVRSSTLFTTHTPVPAGHDAFEEDLLRKYISHYHSRLTITWDELMALGQCKGDSDKKFNMSFLAARMSQEVNGVSKLHGEVSQAMFNKLWPGYLKEELFIGYVTNGVHHPTWTAPEWREIYRQLTGNINFDQTDRALWDKLYSLEDKNIYEVKTLLKKNLFANIRKRLQSDMIEKHVSPHTLLSISGHLDEKALTIGFARRFATYKRASLLFRDLDRLARIVNKPGNPVQFIYAGKAHPNDGGGKDLIKRVFEISQMPQFAGKVIFLENYDIEMAKYLTRGVDIWLNTPTRPLEASGTSGEKAVMNGTIHFSVLDGWWVEGYRAFAGWALPKKITYENSDLQDDIDAETIYNMLEYEIVPAYYSFNEQGVPVEWVSLIKNTMVKIAPEFTMKRMIDDYYEKYYSKLFIRNKYLIDNNFEKAKELAAWKKTIKDEWDNIEVLNYSFEHGNENVYRSGHDYMAEIALDVKKIPKENVGVEFIITRMSKRGEHEFVASEEFKLLSCKNGKCLYRASLVPEKAGSFFYGIRIYPKHKDLPHKQDFYLLRWID